MALHVSNVFPWFRWHSSYKTWMFKNTFEPKDSMAKDNKVIQKLLLLLVMLVILICLFFGLQIASISKKCSHSAQ
jgi:hypothetical protein